MSRPNAARSSQNTADGKPRPSPGSSCPHPEHHAQDTEPVDDRHARTRAGVPIPRPSVLASMPAKTGLASQPELFVAAVRSTALATGLTDRQIAHDYWLIRSLFGVSEMLPEDGAVLVPAQTKRKPDRHVGKWAFGGGTSLTAAWGVVERYSEDIDGNLFADEEISRSAFANVHRRISRAACDAVEASGHDTLGRTVRTTMISLDGQPNLLKFETTLQAPDDELVETQTVTSLIGAHASLEPAGEYPEVGGFRMPCVRPEWTAVNKLDALHRRAEVGDLAGLTDRGRDLYDLWALACSDHATAIRQRIPELWERAAGGIRTPVPRPDHGYGASPALMLGTAANDALRVGYERAVETTVWGDAPHFRQAIEAARGLDLQ